MAGFVGSSVDKGFNWFNEVRKSTDATENAIRFVGFSAVALMAIRGTDTPFLKNLSGSKLLENADLINSAFLFPSIDYWVDLADKYFTCNGNPRPLSEENKSFLFNMGMVTWTAVSASCVTLLLDQWKFIDLGKLAISLGNKVTMLRPVIDLGSMVIVRTQLAVGFLLMDLYNIQQLSKLSKPDISTNPNDLPLAMAKYEAKLRQRRIDIVQLTSQVAMNVLFITGATVSSPAIIGLGLVAYGLGVVSYVHKQAYNKEIVEPSTPRVKKFSVLNPSDWVDFSSKICCTFLGLDAFSKLSTGAISFSKAFDFKAGLDFVTLNQFDFSPYFKALESYSVPFENAKETFSNFVGLGKLTSLPGRIHTLGKQICEGKVGYIETLGMAALTVVTSMESYGWYAGMSELGKVSALFKSWRNGFYASGLSVIVVSDTWNINMQVPHAEGKIKNWDLRNQLALAGNQSLLDYYNSKLTAADAPESKKPVWEKKANKLRIRSRR